MTSTKQFLEQQQARANLTRAQSFQSGAQVPPDLLQLGQPGQGAQGYMQSGPTGQINSGQNPEYFKALRRQGYFITEPFTVTATEAVKLRDLESRTYLIIQNTGSSDIYVGFGFKPTQAYSLTLIPGAAYEPWVIPVNEVWVLGQGNSTGLLMVATEG